jgi:glycosyltransferase involved in cell wall biosynthesis
MSKLATTSLTKNEVANSKQTVKYAQNRLDHDRRNATPVLKHLHLVSAKVWGGGEQYVYNVCKEERRLGHETFVAVDAKQPQIGAGFQDVATVIKVPLRGFMGMRAFAAIKKIIREQGINTLNCHSGNITLLCGLLKKKFPPIKFVVFRHNLSGIKQDNYHKWLQKTADAFICVSQKVFDLQVETAQPAYKSKFHLVYSGIDFDRFSGPMATLAKKPGEFRLGYAGRLVENKGLLVLLKATALVGQKGYKVHLMLCGNAEGNFTEILHKEIQALSLQDTVSLLDRNVDINKFYRSLDIFVLPSIVKEAFGLVLCEAMFCGVPVITTDSGAQAEIVQNGYNGLIVKPGDAEGLAAALINLLDDAEQRKLLAHNGQQVVCAKFSVNKCVEGINEVYDNITTK